MNVYPLFPTPIDIKIDIKIKGKYDLDLNDIINNQIYNIPDQNIKELDDKINEINSIPEEEIQTRTKGMVRKFFSYEIIDKLKLEYGAEYVTNAWLKCFEITTYFKLLENINEDTINYFGICEQPGAFVYALNHFIKTKLDKNFNFIIQSLIDPKNKKIFKAENKLFSKYYNNYDYGKDRTGNVTKIENIRYYRDKYKNKKFHIITADCGLDCSADFIAQEQNLLDVVIGQFMLAISIASQGTHYFFKLFTMHKRNTQEIIFLANLLFQKVSICRALTTKPESGEIYCICKNFKNKLPDNILDKLLNWYQSFKNNGLFLFKKNIIDDNFINFIEHTNQFLAYRRITSINFLLFRFNNARYSKNEKNKKIYKYINDLVEHYTKYFIEYCDIKKLDKNKNLT